MKRFIVLSIFFLLCANLTFSQVNQVWVKRYSSTNNVDVSPIAMKIDKSGNIYVAGSVGNTTSIYKSYVTLKYNSSGTLLWSAEYNGNGNPGYGASGLAIDSSGNVYVTGSLHFDGASFDCATVKYSPNGIQQWAAVFNSSYNKVDVPSDIKIDNAGNIYIAGYSDEQNSDVDYLIVKYNPNGQQLWFRKYNGEANSRDIGRRLNIDINDNVYITGSSTSLTTSFDIATIKYDSSGTQQWAASYSTFAGSDYVSEFVIDNKKKLYLTGNTNGYGTNLDLITIKYDSLGNQKWVKRYNGTYNYEDMGKAIQVDRNGNVYVTGIVFNNQDRDFITIKYDNSGSELWIKTYDNGLHLDAIPYDMTLDTAGNVFITGLSDNNTTGSEWTTIKYSTDGIEQWVMKYPGNGDNNLGSIIVTDNSNNIYVTGKNRQASKFDMVTIKYSQLVEINNYSNDIPDKFSLYQNYPNPFNPTTKIKFDIPKSSDIKLIIFDAVGREIKNIAQNNLTAGSYEYEFNGENLSSGIYYFKLQTNEFSKTMKMALVK